MVTNCFGGYSGLLGLDELAFVCDVGLLMIAATPAVIVYVLWRIFVTNRVSPAGTLILGLDENAATYTKLYGRRIPWRALSIYVLTSAVTFKLGVLAFEGYTYIQDLLASLSSK